MRGDDPLRGGVVNLLLVAPVCDAAELLLVDRLHNVHQHRDLDNPVRELCRNHRFALRHPAAAYALDLPMMHDSVGKD